jgi:hypothetical protein
MFSKPSAPIGPTNTHAMMTRSMARHQENIPMQNLNRMPTPIAGSLEDLSIPRINNFSLGGSTRGSLHGSLNDLAHQPVPFNRLGSTPGSRENLSYNSPNITRVGSSFRGTTYTNLSPGEEISLHSMGGGPGSGSSNTLFENSIYGLNRNRNRGVDPAQVTRRFESLPFAGDLDVTQSTPNLSGRQVFYRAGDQEVTFRGPQLSRVHGSPRIDIPRGGYIPLVGGRPQNVREAFTRAIQRHKRKILIGGAVVGGAALLAGSIYGALNSDLRNFEKHKQGLNQYLPHEPNKAEFASAKKEFATIKKETKAEQVAKKDITANKELKKEMQYDKPTGVFERMSSNSLSGGNYLGGGGGGGGSSSGGGFGNYQHALKLAKKMLGGKVRRKRRAKKSAPTKAKHRKTRHGKIVRRRKVKKHVNRKRINRRAKKNRRKHNKAF